MTDVFKIGIKLFVESDTFAPAEFVPIFHRWIQSQAIADHLLIDVADYAHVPAGPGTLLVTLQANIHMDYGDNRLGLLYVRKQPLAGAGTFGDRLRGVLGETLKIAGKLEEEPTLAGRLKFRTNEIAIRFYDRLLAPNTAETFAAVKPDIEALAADLYDGRPVKIEHYNPSPLTLMEVRIRAGESPSIGVLLEAAGGSSVGA